MNRSSACGPDGIYIRILLLCFDAIGPVLRHIINACLTSCDFPDSWKHSLVYPIFKSSDPAVISNYRPISIVPVIAKVVERVVQRQRSAYMSDNYLPSSSQHGLRSSHLQKPLCSLSLTISFPTWTAGMSLFYVFLISVNASMSFLTHCSFPNSTLAMTALRYRPGLVFLLPLRSLSVCQHHLLFRLQSGF